MEHQKSYTYTWTDGEWFLQDGGGGRTVNIRVNNGFSGIELACEKADLGFTIDVTSPGDSIMAVSSDAGRTLFTSTWLEENTPSTSRDDVTESTHIPEFSTMLIPVASVMLIVGNRIRNKDK